MISQILVSNLAGEKGDILLVQAQSTKWTSNESLKAWLAEYPNRPTSEYHRNYSIITITDKSPVELTHLTETRMVNGNPIGSRWHFVPPVSGTVEWIELYTTGEISKRWNEVLPYLVENT